MLKGYNYTKLSFLPSEEVMYLFREKLDILSRL